jgi:CRP-like cAMP-binding protein
MMILVHLANLVYLLAYLVKDILWLRVTTCVAGLVLLASFLVQAQPPWSAVAWNLVFFAINVVQIQILVRERRPVRLRTDEQRLYQLVFRSLRPREFLRLLAVGGFAEHTEGEVLIEAGQGPGRIMVIVDGEAEVRHDGRSVAALGPGRFVGEMSYLTGELPGAEVRARASLRVAAWPVEGLRRFLDEHPDLRAAWQLVIGHDLVRKLRPATASPRS